MLLVALIALVLAIIPLPYVGDVSDAVKRAYANATNVNPDTVATGITAGTYVSAVIRVIGAIGFVILALFNLRGSNVTRIITWVFAGLGVLCCGAGTAASNVNLTMQGNANGVDTKEATRQISDAYPSWYNPTNTALMVVAVVALILVIILLALPAVHPFFRRGGGGQQVAEPPLPYPPVA
ncbi:MAG: hypothetical protein J2P15_13390 [Micromonosporaceae bacterium]|nr:hypothetical protein [Micromonosporaceae bacterium]